MLESFTFEDPWYLLLLPILAATGYYASKQKWTSSVRMLSSDTNSFLRINTWRTLLYGFTKVALALAMILAIVALARPQRQYVEQDEEAEGIDIFLVMDVSTSMLARDFTPDRLEASKAVAQAFVGERPFDRIGVSAFATEAFTLTPLTLDKQVIDQMLAGLTTGRTRSATAIGMGLASAVNGLRDSDSPSKVVILLTDGVNNTGTIDPRTAAGLAEEFNIRVYTIGVGTNGAAMTPTLLPNGRTSMVRVRVQLDEALLKEIADRTGGRYFRATDNASLAQIYSEIDRLEKTTVSISVSRRFDDLFPYALGAALAFGLLAGILRIWVVPTVV